MPLERTAWRRHVQNVLRSRHYTRLCEGLGGEPVEIAVESLLTDIRHLCHLADVSFDELLQQSQEQFDQERGEYESGVINPNDTVIL